jgi:hypothetical protein
LKGDPEVEAARKAYKAADEAYKAAENEKIAAGQARLKVYEKVGKFAAAYKSALAIEFEANRRAHAAFVARERIRPKVASQDGEKVGVPAPTAKKSDEPPRMANTLKILEDAFKPSAENVAAGILNGGIHDLGNKLAAHDAAKITGEPGGAKVDGAFFNTATADAILKGVHRP